MTRDQRPAVPGHRVAVNGVLPGAVSVLVGVGAADACGMDLEQELAGPYGRVGDVLDPDVAGSVVDGRSHARLTPWSPSSAVVT